MVCSGLGLGFPGVPFLGAGSARLCREPLLSYISFHEKMPPLPPFLSRNIHLTSQIFLDKAVGNCKKAGLVCQDPWPYSQGMVQGKGSSPASCPR